MATAKKPTRKPAKKVAVHKAAKKPAVNKSAKKAAAKKPATKKAAAKKSAAKKPAAKKPAAKKAAPKKPAAKKSAAKKPAAKKAAPKKPAAKKAVKPAKKAPVKASAKSSVTSPPAAVARPAAKAPERKSPPKKIAPPERPPVKGVTKDGIAYTKDFDAKWLTAQRALLLNERASVLGQAVRLEEEANQIIEEQEMGDVQFDDEGGEGDTMVVERERDLALGAQARQTVADIEAALERLTTGAYGYSVESARPIPRERLEAIPWATVLVEEKVGGIGRL